MENFNMESKCHCVICLWKPPVIGNRRGRASLQGLFSLQKLTEYLGVDLSKVFIQEERLSSTPTPSSPTKVSQKLNGYLCAGCSLLSNKFSDLVVEMEKIQREMKDVLGLIHGKMVNKDVDENRNEVNNFKEEMLKDSLNSADALTAKRQYDVVIRWREEVLEKYVKSVAQCTTSKTAVGDKTIDEAEPGMNFDHDVHLMTTWQVEKDDLVDSGDSYHTAVIIRNIPEVFNSSSSVSPSPPSRKYEVNLNKVNPATNIRKMKGDRQSAGYVPVASNGRRGDYHLQRKFRNRKNSSDTDTVSVRRPVKRTDCGICKESFPSRMELLNHIRYAHVIDNPDCAANRQNYGGSSSQGTAVVTRTERTARPNYPYKCGVAGCGRRFLTAQRRLVHQRGNHVNAFLKFQCHYCSNWNLALN